MKKIFILLAAASLFAVACNKSELRMDVGQTDEMTMRPLASKMTKAGELTGISMPKTYGIYAAGTQRTSNGIIENASFFPDPFEQLFGTTEDDPTGIGTAAAVADTRLWHAGSYAASTFTPAPMYWPIGGVKMDFLAYALPMAEHQSTGLSDGTWSATWDNATTDAASQFTFNDVDTYAHQVDVLYAAANGQTNSSNGGPGNSTAMAFRHAQALLIFNVRVNEIADNVLQIDDIEFITDERLAALQEHEYALASNPSHVLAALTDGDVTLLTKGDWMVNNARNDMFSGWSGLSSAKENYRMPVTAITGPSNANNVVLAQTTAGGHDDAFVSYAAAIPYLEDTAHAQEYAQLGETLMIPEQPKVNFVIKYTINPGTPNAKTFFYKYNDLRGTWQQGKKYLYNLDLTMNEIVITEGVSDWADAALADIPLN